MTKFSDLAILNNYHRKMPHPSCSVSLTKLRQQLFLQFNNKDIITDASYEGTTDPWLNVVCSLLINKSLNEALEVGWKDLEKKFGDDQFFWDLRSEQNENVFFNPFELLRATLDSFRGRDYLYQETSPLICRCFGVRESDVLEYLKTEAEPTLEKLTAKTKAGMGCRSCVPQLKLRLALNSPANKNRFYKDRPVAEWLLEIDAALMNFFEASGWNLEVQSLKGNQVVISFDKVVTQKEEEEMGPALQRFLEVEVDRDLGFFLVFIRDLQRSKIS